MSLLKPEAPDTDYSLFNETSISFLRGIKRHYTRETATQAIEALKPILGTDWFSRVIFGVMSQETQPSRRCWISRDWALPDKKINAIKAVRFLTDLGLTEAKNFIESCHPGKILDIKSKLESQSETDWNREIALGVSELRDSGYKVEVA